MADPVGGTTTCHNDVCLENVVLQDGLAVGLLDFDFCAPSRPLCDLAQFARMCVPIDDDINASGLGWHAADRTARLRLVADSSGLDAHGRTQLLAVLDDSIPEVASSCARGSKPETRTSSRCGTTCAARNGSPAAVDGGLSTETASPTYSPDVAPRNLC
jgi:hypothetical protein